MDGCCCSVLGAVATDQEREKLNPYGSSEHQSVNVLTDISFHVAKVSCTVRFRFWFSRVIILLTCACEVNSLNFGRDAG